MSATEKLNDFWILAPHVDIFSGEKKSDMNAEKEAIAF